MGPGFFSTLLRRLLVACALLLASPAAAAPAGACHAAASAAEGEAAVAADPGRWICRNAEWSLAAERTYLRFAIPPGEPGPTVFATRLTRFTAMRLTVVAADGRRAWREVRTSDMQPASDGWVMRTRLPRLDAPVAEVLVAIDGARHVGMLSQARLLDEASLGVSPPRRQLLIAALCGLLCAPFLFNFAFYRVLRQRFLAWHSLALFFMLLQTLITSGLINSFATLSVSQLGIASTVAFGIGIAAAGLFTADFIEPDKLDGLHRRLLVAVAPWIAAFTALYVFAEGPLRAVAPKLYSASWIPVLALFAWVMAVAWRRGSRAVRFQVAAWAPFMVVGSVRIASMLGATPAPLGLDFEQQLAVTLEVLIAGLGVVDRFMILRRQRDQALFETKRLGDAAERDPLTGLRNRRGIEERFETFRAVGFDTLAVVDLDHFKRVNDAMGHAVGDRVLAVAAAALEDDPDLIAWRIGGEEFLLLLRGRNASARAEARRRAIPVRVAATIEGLPGPVTASMGLIEMPRGAMLATTYAELYSRADQLLYEAKHAGRNRTIAEKLTVFGGADRRRGGDRRRHARQAA